MRKCPQCGSSYEDAIAFCPADGTHTEALSSAAAVADTLIDTVIDGRYRIEQRIGEGGMGVVYRATHVVLRKPFALKLIRGEQATDQSTVQRFLREARAASGIGHPNIVNVNDFGTLPDGSVYLAMEYLKGVTLAQAMSGAPIAFARALQIFIQIAGALEAAHEQGIVHRDLKPENIFLLREDDQHDFVKVLDFGIAKVKNAAAKITRTGIVFGTPHYMSPEQAAGQPVDHRSDIYSLGVIMYQVLAGELPFTAETLMALMTKHMFEPAPSLRELGYAVPSLLDAIVSRCLQKKPELRHSSMRELEADLRRVQLSPVSEPRSLASMSIAASLVGAAASAPPAAFTVTSETLEAALLSDVAQDEDDEPIAVPKRRPVWLWAVAAGLFVMLVLSLGARRWQAQQAGTLDAVSGEARDAAAAGSAAPSQAELPSGLSAPVTPAVQPTAAQEIAEPSTPTAGAQDQARAAKPTKLEAPATKRAAAGGAQSAAHAPKLRAEPIKPAPKSNSKPGAQHGESLLDPWR